MKPTILLSLFGGVLLMSLTAGPTTVQAASHQWRFNELFSNPEGTIQFIEMRESAGFISEHELGGKWILAVGAENQYNFRSDLTGNTANRYLLLATQGFADLPGAPTPDFIVPNGFLPVEGETLEYWMYAPATWTYEALPQDGVHSRNADGSDGVNSPTNYAGESGSIDLSVPVEPTTWSGIKTLY